MATPVRNDSGATKYASLSSAAKALGEKGGKQTSPEKKKSSAANGKLGGRPSKE